MMKLLISYLSIFSMLFPNFALANEKKKELDLNILALPSEVKNVSKSSGAVFYSPSVKGKILIPVNIWGEVKRSGLHFVPLDTSLIEGLSFAGGPTNSGKLDTVKISRREGEKIQSEVFDLSQGGDDQANLKLLKPGDTIFIEKSTFSEDRSYYTSLFGVVATILSSILIYRQVKD